MLKRFAVLASTLVLASLATVACGRNKEALPDEATFYLQTPEDDAAELSAAGNTATQAVCANADSHTKLVAFIEAENDAIADKLALLKALVRAGRRVGPNGEITKTITKNGNTATIDVKNDGAGNIDYSVTFTPAGGTASKVLTGTSKEDLTSGSWDFQGLTQNRTVHVDWTNENDTLTVNRDAKGDFGERTSTYVRTATTVDITFHGPQHEATAHWDRTTHDGNITVDGTETCFAADPADAQDGSAYCTVPCSSGGEGEGEGEGGQ
jgi:hypothetical protein